MPINFLTKKLNIKVFGVFGDSTKVKVIQVGMLKPEGEMWPLENIFKRVNSKN